MGADPRAICTSLLLAIGRFSAGLRENAILQNRLSVPNEVGPVNADPANPRFAFLYGQGMPTPSRVHGAAHCQARRPGCRHQQRLPDFIDALSDARLPARIKLKAFAAVWRRGEDD